MKLTRAVRLMLSNQYRILARLYPDEAEDFETARTIIERGYEYEYDRLAQHVYDERNVTTEEESEDLVEILTMFDSLKQSYTKLSDNSDINEYTDRSATPQRPSEPRHHSG